MLLPPPRMSMQLSSLNGWLLKMQIKEHLLQETFPDTLRVKAPSVSNLCLTLNLNIFQSIASVGFQVFYFSCVSKMKRLHIVPCCIFKHQPNAECSNRYHQIMQNRIDLGSHDKAKGAYLQKSSGQIICQQSGTSRHTGEWRKITTKGCPWGTIPAQPQTVLLLHEAEMLIRVRPTMS